MAKEQEDSSRTSPTAEDRPIRGDGGPRGGLRAPGPAITRHRQTIHKAREGGEGRSVERRKDISGGGSLDGFAMPLPVEFWVEFYRHQSAL